MKKIMRVFMAMMLILSMALPTVAQAVTNTGSITIKNDPLVTGISMVNHTFGGYKVFDLTLGTDANGDNYSYSIDTDFVEFFEGKVTTEDVSTPAKLNKFAVDYVQNHTNINELAVELKDYIVVKNISSEAVSNGVSTTTDNKEKVTINNLPLGYYIIVDNGNGGDTSIETSIIAALALGTTDSNLEINLKASAPTVDKEIKDDDNDQWGVVGDHQIGDVVEYRLTATVPSNLTGYNNYTYIIHDSLSAGLSFNNDVKIYVGDKDAGGILLNTNNTVTAPALDGHTVDISVDILKAIAENEIKPGDKLYIYYSATLNENAIAAGGSNDNTVHLEYSNDPYNENSTVNTPGVTVRDYTFRLNVFKTKEDGKTALEGAKFGLFIGDEEVFFKRIEDADGIIQYIVCEDEHVHGGTECSSEMISPADGRFSIIGLDDNIEYTIKETEAPAGYNAIDPINFIIETEYDELGNITSITTNVDGIAVEGNSFELGATIVNTTGSMLPETGGIGTTLFTIVGGLLMASALGVIVIKSRKKTA